MKEISFSVHSEQKMIATNGNRCDVDLIQWTHTPIYWIDQPNEVRRSRWFYSTAKDSQLIPLDQSTDEILEVKQSPSFFYSISHFSIETLHGNMSASILACKTYSQ